MGIDGRMHMAFLPGSYLQPGAMREREYEKMKRLITKLNLQYTVLETPNGLRDKIKSLNVNVTNNRNFWFHLTQLPKLLIPYFWKLSEDELEQKRMELISNNDWGIGHMKRLALQMHGGIVVDEEYDSTAAGHYTYTIGVDDPQGKTAAIHYTLNDGVLDHCAALQKQIEVVKTIAKELEAKDPNDKPRIYKKEYWGMFK